MDWLRISSTALWWSGAACLLAKQGVLRRERPYVDCGELCRRLKTRLRCKQPTEVGRRIRSVALVSVLGSSLLIAVGLGTGFCQLALPEHWTQIVICLAYVLVMPGFVEEVIFRGLLFSLPHSLEEGKDTQQPGPLRSASSQSLNSDKKAPDSGTDTIEDGVREPYREASTNSAAVTLSSPTQLSSRPPLWEQMLVLSIFILYHLDWLHQKDVFKDWRFLIMACILGLCCQETMFATGSLWPGILLHAVWVCGWLTLLGGAERTLS